jgi:hypothetical protein
MKIKYQSKAIVQNTHIDLQGEAFTKTALDSMARQVHEHPVWVTYEHDQLCPPLGKIIEANVESLGNNHYQLVANKVLFDLETYEVLSNLKSELNILRENISKIEFKDNLSATFNKHKLDSVEDSDLFSLEVEIPIDFSLTEKSLGETIAIFLAIDFLVKDFAKSFISEMIGVDPKILGRKAAKILKEDAKIFYTSISKLIDKNRVQIVGTFSFQGMEVSGVVDFSSIDDSKVQEFLDIAVENFGELCLAAATLSSLRTGLTNATFIFDPRIVTWDLVFCIDKSQEVFLGNFGKEYVKHLPNFESTE